MQILSKNCFFVPIIVNMVSFRPFKAILPTAQHAHKVVTRPFDSYTKDEVEQVLRESEFSFLHVIVPVAEEMKRKALSAEERLRLGKKEFEHLLSVGALQQHPKAAYYIYRQTDSEGHTFTGIMGAASIHDYMNGLVKEHEATLEYKEVLLKEYLEVIDIHAEPVYLTVPDNVYLNELFEKHTRLTPNISLTLHGKQHEIWVAADEADIEQISQAFAQTPAMYIADGHHRSASSSLYGKERMANNPNHTGNEAYNGFLAVVIPESGAKLYEFSRLVKDLGEHSPESFLTALGADFFIDEVHTGEMTPRQRHEFGLYTQGKAYRLKLRNEPPAEKPLDNLDPQLMNVLIFDPLLHITDLRKDKRVKFIGGKANVTQLVKEVDSGRYKAAFLSYPVPFEQFKQIADTGMVMPPKSTWFEPKFPSALVIYPLKD